MPADACRIALGGLALRLSPAPLVRARAPWLDVFADSKERSDAVDLTLDVGDPADWRPPLAAGFTYDRFDLRFVMDPARRRAAAVFDGHPDGLLAVLELAVAGALAPSGGLLLHAAGVVIDGRAWLLPGPSGTGKSTAARAPDITRVLSDERVIVRRTSSGWRAWGTPWWSTGRTRPFDSGYAAVGGIARLHKAPRLALRPLAPDTAATWLLRSVSLYEETPFARWAAFESACDLVEAVRCVDLELPREGRWSQSISQG